MVTNSSDFPDDWYDLLKLDHPLDMEDFLQSDLLAARRSHSIKVSIGNLTSGSISFISSILLVVHILRSHECLSSPYHRLIFGLSVADIISSFCIALSTTMVPKEMSYIAPFASGNVATCNAQGFLLTFATGASFGYNCSICFYYSAIITYNKKFDYIRNKLEPWFHGISILVPLVICIILLATDAYNGAIGSPCFYPYPHDPPHCIGYEAGAVPEGYSIPCGRGGENDGLSELRIIAMFGTHFWMLIITPITIFVTMACIFRSVTNIEKQMENYGVSALRLRTTLLAAPTTTTNDKSPAQQEEARGFGPKKLKEMIGKYLCLTADDSQANHLFFPICCFPCAGDDGCDDPERPSRTTKSNRMTSQKRAVLHMSVGYAGAWILTWTPYFVLVVILVVTKSVPTTVSIMTNCMGPLNGFFNFLVFMAPKVRTTRTLAMRRRGSSSDNNHKQNQQQRLTWCQAFYKAYMSRGRRLDDRSLRNINRTERRITKTIVRKMHESFLISFKRMKLFSTMSSATAVRTSSPDVTTGDTNECFLESGGMSAVAGP